MFFRVRKKKNVLCGDYNLYQWINHSTKKVKWSRYRPGVAQRVGRGIALLFYDRGTRRGWVVNSTPWPHFTPEKGLVPILQEAGWAPGLAWVGGKSRPHRDLIPDHPAHSQFLYQLSYLIHKSFKIFSWNLAQGLITKSCHGSISFVKICTVSHTFIKDVNKLLPGLPIFLDHSKWCMLLEIFT